MAATVDYLFGHDAADVVDDWMYEQVGRLYPRPNERQVLRRSNPGRYAVCRAAAGAAERGLWAGQSPDLLDDLRGPARRRRRHRGPVAGRGPGLG
ncbi:MAG: cobaltochelatase subunit CobN [Dehalococcoidia bacterium]